MLCRSEGIDPLALKGSYAGAMGMPQFMPSSFNRYAVDFDGDGHVDLHRNPADVIGSVANYLADVRLAARPADPLRSRAAGRPGGQGAPARARHPARVQRRRVRGGAARASATPASRRDSKLALVELQNGDGAPSYVAGTTNFYAITRYNWSSYYAMAVIELGEAVARERASVAR